MSPDSGCTLKVEATECADSCDKVLMKLGGQAE